MLHRSKYFEAVNLAPHYIAIGQTDVNLWDVDLNSDLPWEYVKSIEEGGTWRLGIPTSFYLIADHPCGLEFSWSIDFEDMDANGTGTNKLNNTAFYEMVDKLPNKVRPQLLNLIKDKLLPEVRNRVENLKQSLYIQMTSETILEKTIDKIYEKIK